MTYSIDSRPLYKIAEEVAQIKDEFSDSRRSIADTLGRSSGQGIGWIEKWMITKAIEELIDAKIEAFADRVQEKTGVRP